MIDYIKENCVVPPMDEPTYDEDSDTWDLWFEASENEFFPYDTDDIVCLPFESKEEADKIYNKVIELVNEQQICN
jgi:hypothetical protein